MAALQTFFAGRKVTIDDIAREASVSPATVSRVLNEKTNVSSSTQKKVLDAAQKLHYFSLPGGKANTRPLVGVALPDLENPESLELVQALNIALSHAGMGMLLEAQLGNATNDARCIHHFLDSAVAGAIFVGCSHADTQADHTDYQKLSQAGISLSLIDGYASDITASCFSMDMKNAFEMAISHLIMLGHVRIGLAMGPQRFIEMQRAEEAFLAAMKMKNASNTAHVAVSLSSVEGGYAACRELIHQHCTAVVCTSPAMALGAYQAAQNNGMPIPEKLSIISLGDFPEAPFLSPSLTVVRKPVIPMCEAAVNALSTSLSSGRQASKELLFRSSLIVRGSTGSH